MVKYCFWISSRMKLLSFCKFISLFIYSLNAESELNKWNMTDNEQLSDLNLANTRLENAIMKFEDLKYKIVHLNWKFGILKTTFSRMYSQDRMNNVNILGLKYSDNIENVIDQLVILAKYLDIEFNGKYVSGIKQYRLERRPEYSKAIVRFHKIRTKQQFLMRFKQKLGEFVKAQNHPQFFSRKVPNIPGLPGSEIIIDDDLTQIERELFIDLRRVQKRFPSLMKCYVKDCKVYYKLTYEFRPNIVDTFSQVRNLAMELLKKESISKYRNDSDVVSAIFRSGTAFPKHFYKRMPKLENVIKSSKNIMQILHYDEDFITPDKNKGV